MKSKALINNFCFVILILFTLILTPTYSNAKSNQHYDEIEWIQLMPKEDLDVLLNPPGFLSTIQDGSEQDSVQVLSDVTAQNDNVSRFQKALTSVRVMKN